MTNRNEHFWTQYYHTTTDDICEPSSFAKFVYEQYIEPETAPKTIVDLGCGNCRDSRFFSNTGNATMCYAIDPNLIMDALKWRPSDNLILVKNNAIDGLRVDVEFDIVFGAHGEDEDEEVEEEEEAEGEAKSGAGTVLVLSMMGFALTGRGSR